MVHKPFNHSGIFSGREVCQQHQPRDRAGVRITSAVLLLVQAADTNASATAIASYQPVQRQHDYAVPLLPRSVRDPASQRAETVAEEIHDHCAIYLLIAGTYTVLLVGLNSPLAEGG